MEKTKVKVRELNPIEDVAEYNGPTVKENVPIYPQAYPTFTKSQIGLIGISNAISIIAGLFIGYIIGRFP